MFSQSILFLVCAICLSTAYNVTTYTYKTVGDLKIDLDLYIPPVAAPVSGYPIVFAIHGGGDISGGKQESMTLTELDEIMRRGWAIVSIDYRLLPGVVLQDILEDVQDAYKWIQTSLPKIAPVDLNHLTVFGGSAGGGLAVLSGYKLSPRPQAIIALYSFCTNWTDPYSYKPETPVDPALAAAANKLAVPVVTEYFPNGTDLKSALWGAALVAGKMGWLVTTHDPHLPTDQIMSKLREFSATENVDQNYPPTYLAHGLADTFVPYSQSVQLANKFQEKNITYVLDLVPNADHVFDADSAFWQQHVLPAFDFVQKYMTCSSAEKTLMKFLEK